MKFDYTEVTGHDTGLQDWLVCPRCGSEDNVLVEQTNYHKYNFRCLDCGFSLVGLLLWRALNLPCRY